MFENTLLIIKSDYLHKRKALLKFILGRGFQIQAMRKILFSPELAAEFYEELSDDPCFMFQVILLSKGNSEAFILAKECAKQDLINSAIWYFGTASEMERNVHVTKSHAKVQQEISFIFPNYIHEPIHHPEEMKFCENNPLVAPLIGELYDIIMNTEKDPHKGWKEKLSEWLILSNKSMPHVTNQCCRNPKLNIQELAQQTKITCIMEQEKSNTQLMGKCSSTDARNFDTDCTSPNMTSSSCISCSGFGSVRQSFEDINKPTTAALSGE